MDAPSSEWVVRRANVEDLPGLRALWERTGLQILDLERRLTDFQLVATPDGDLLAAMGLCVQGRVGLIHSEAFTQPDFEEMCRQLLWERLLNLAHSHGLTRLWAQEPTPFWATTGFQSTDPTVMPPQVSLDLCKPGTKWISQSLRGESVDGPSPDQEFEIFQQAARAETERVIAQAKMARTFGYFLALVVFTVVVVLGIILILRTLPKSAQSPGPVPRPPLLGSGSYFASSRPGNSAPAVPSDWEPL